MYKKYLFIRFNEYLILLILKKMNSYLICYFVIFTIFTIIFGIYNEYIIFKIENKIFKIENEKQDYINFKCFLKRLPKVITFSIFAGVPLSILLPISLIYEYFFKVKIDYEDDYFHN